MRKRSERMSGFEPCAPSVASTTQHERTARMPCLRAHASPAFASRCCITPWVTLYRSGGWPGREGGR